MNKSFVVNTFKVLLVRGSGAIAGFLVTFTIPFVLDADKAGLVFLFIAISLFIGGLNAAGTPNFILRKVGADWPSNNIEVNSYHNYLLNLILAISVPILCISALAPNLLIAYLPNSAIILSLLPFVGISSVLYALTLFFANSLVGQGAVAKGSIVQNGISQFTFVLVTFILYVVFDGISLVAVIFSYIVGLVLAILFGAFEWYKNKLTTYSFSLKLTSEDRRSLFNFFLMLATSQCVQFAGQFAVAANLSSSDVALFTLSLRVALITSFVLIAVNLIVAPQFAKAYKNDDVEMINRLALQSGRFMFGIAIPVVTLLALYAEEILSVFGEEYRAASGLLRIFVFAQLINVSSGSVGYILNMTNHESDMRNIIFISGAFSLLSAFVLTWKYGLQGAAWSTAISLVLQNLLAVYYVKKRLGFNTLNLYRKV